MALPTLYTPHNNAFSLLTVQHNISDGQLVVSDVSTFGSPTPSNPIKVVCGVSIMSIVDITGNILTIGSFLEGTSDSTMPVNSVVEVRITALDVSSLQDGLRSIKSDVTYVHTQSIPAAIWNINHNLDKFPAVAVEDSGGSWVIGNVDYIDSNNITLTFVGAFGGKAYLN